MRPPLQRAGLESDTEQAGAPGAPGHTVQQVRSKGCCPGCLTANQVECRLLSSQARSAALRLKQKELKHSKEMVCVPAAPRGEAPARTHGAHGALGRHHGGWRHHARAHGALEHARPWAPAAWAASLHTAAEVSKRVAASCQQARAGLQVWHGTMCLLGRHSEVCCSWRSAAEQGAKQLGVLQQASCRCAWGPHRHGHAAWEHGRVHAHGARALGWPGHTVGACTVTQLQPDEQWGAPCTQLTAVQTAPGSQVQLRSARQQAGGCARAAQAGAVLARLLAGKVSLKAEQMFSKARGWSP